jgi:SAM-dependent methyltransferase
VHRNPPGIKSPETIEDVKALYNYLYKRGRVIHPRKGELPRYGSQQGRVRWFINWIEKNVPAGSKILDAGCGRGQLAVELKALGYRVEGTEICDCLVNVELPNRRIKAHMLPYDDLHLLGEDSFDVVCSNDVMEHLLNLDQVANALANFCFVAKKFVCLSISVKGGTVNYTTALNLQETIVPNRANPPIELHRFIRDGKWWEKMITKFLEPMSVTQRMSHLVFFGRVR